MTPDDGAYFSDGTPVPDEPSGKSKGPTQAQQLVEMAMDQYRLVRSTDGRTYAVPRIGPMIAVPLASKAGGGVRARLGASLYRSTGQVASGSALSDCVNVLEGEAADAEPVPVYLRMGREGPDTVVVDMGTETGACVVVTPRGWSIEASSPVIFRRSETLSFPLVEPVRGGSLDGLRSLINLTDEDYRLTIGWVVAAFFTEIPHPLLFVQGEQGTAKSNLIRALFSMIDPQPAADRTAPADKREWAIFARASWAFNFDNITEIPDWLSNALCKGVTGDAVLQRALHSDEDVIVFSFRRVIAMTTIAIKHELAGDLADRLLLVEPEVIDTRLTEEQVTARREAALPAAFGAVLDLLSGVLRELPDVELADPPRMADFARVLAALDQVTGWDTLGTYRTKVAAMGMTQIEGDPLAQALYWLAHSQPPGAAWEGTSSQLIATLREVCAAHDIPVQDIPSDPRVGGKRVREIAPSLRKVGTDVRPLPRTETRRGYRVQRLTRAPQPVADDPSFQQEEMACQ